MLTNEDEFLHAIAVLVVPVFAQLGIIRHELHEFFFGHGSKPLTGFAQVKLFAGLLEEVAHVVFFGKIAHSFATQHVLRPVRRDELIEEPEVERFSRVIYIGVNTKFCEVVMTFVVMVIVIIVIVVMMLMVMRVFDFLNPCRRRSGAVEVKEVGIEQLVEVKLGGDAKIEQGAESLRSLAGKIDTSRMPAPSFLMVITGGGFAYRRSDGVFVVPVGCLKD